MGTILESPEIYVPSGKSRVLALLNVIPGASTCTSGDKHDFDNRLLRQNCHVVRDVYLGDRITAKWFTFLFGKGFPVNRHLAPRLISLKQLPEPIEFRSEDVHLVIAESPISEVNLDSKQYLEDGRCYTF